MADEPSMKQLREQAAAWDLKFPVGTTKEQAAEMLGERVASVRAELLEHANELYDLAVAHDVVSSPADSREERVDALMAAGVAWHPVHPNPDPEYDGDEGGQGAAADPPASDDGSAPHPEPDGPPHENAPEPPAAGERVAITRANAYTGAWWCPICDHCMDDQLNTCQKCGAERDGDEVVVCTE